MSKYKSTLSKSPDGDMYTGFREVNEMVEEEEMDEEYSSISYSGTPVRPDFLNDIIMVLGGMENEAESYGERRFVKVLINKAESLLENGYFNDQG